MAGFGKRESAPVSAFLEGEVVSKPVRLFRPPSPRALEVPSIGRAKTIKAMLAYCGIFLALMGMASVLLLVEDPFSYGRPLVEFITARSSSHPGEP